MQSQFEDSFNLAHRFCQAMKRPMFVSFIETDKTGKDVKNILTRWAGGVDRVSEASMYGPWKAFTLLAAGCSNGNVLTTPIYRPEEGCPYEGGVREKYLICSVSKYSEDRIDAMFALLLLWSFEHEVRLHHVGFKYRNDARRKSAMKAFISTLPCCQLPVLIADVPDSYYIRVEPPTVPQDEMYWMEFQSWPQPLQHDGIHIDVATSDPTKLLRFIEKYSHLEATFWDKGENSPVGMVSGMENDVQISVMARKTWTSPEDW